MEIQGIDLTYILILCVAVIIVVIVNLWKQYATIKDIKSQLILHTANLYHINCVVFPEKMEPDNDN